MAARRGSKKPATAPPGLRHGEFVMYPGTRGEVYDLLERLSAAAADSADFGTPGLSLDRTRLTVRWFGELPTAVQRVVDAAEGVTVTVESTLFRPGELRAEAQRLAAAHPDAVAGVTSTFPLVAEVADG